MRRPGPFHHDIVPTPTGMAMRRFVTRAGAGVALVLGLVLLRMIQRARHVVSHRPDVVPLDDSPVDADRVARALGRIIRHETISRLPDDPPTAALKALQSELTTQFPRVHDALERELVGGLSLLYTWPGSAPGLAPLVLLAHQDVVPIDPGTETVWRQPPFSGSLSDGSVWGRGALDDKGSLVAILAAVEGLLVSGFVPRRSVLLAFGHDEEIGGEAGARAVASLLAERGVHAALVLDEGGAVSDVPLPGLGRVALVGVAEKGSVSLELSVEAPGGHSSIPPRQSAIGIVAEAVRRLETNRLPARIVEPTRATLRSLAPELPFARRLVLANADLLAPLVLRVLARKPALDAAIRSTTAVTVIHGGAKSNVVPKRASAVVNYRILPSESVDDIFAHVRSTVADPRIRVAIEPGTSPRQPSATSPTDGPAFRLLEATIAAHFPGVLVAPFLVPGRTDARHFEPIAENVYRFVPIQLDPDGLRLLHGTDERIAVDGLARAVRFYRELIRRAQVGLPEA